MNSNSLLRLLPLALVAVGLLAGGCSDGDPVTPGIEPEIVNAVDNFQFQVTDVTNYTGTLHYAWANTGTMAVVDQACALSAGSATLELLDGNGMQVYSRNLTEGGSITSSAGTSGDWTILVVLNQVSGTLNFRADKATP